MYNFISNLAYRSAIYPKGMIAKYGLVRRLLSPLLLWNPLLNFLFSVVDPRWCFLEINVSGATSVTFQN